MAEGSWFLVGSLVILLSTDAVTHYNVGCWREVSSSLGKSTLTVYNARIKISVSSALKHLILTENLLTLQICP
jgi:hypothetical protein